METRVAALHYSPGRGARFWVAVASVLLLVAGGLVLLFAWLSVRNYAPLSGTVGGQISPISGVAATVEPAAGSDGKVVYFAALRKRGHISVGFDLWNTGGRPVRLERVFTWGLDPSWRGSLSLAGVRMQPSSERGTDPRKWEPFHPVTLKPDHSVFLILDYRTRCFPRTVPGGSTSSNLLRVRYRYLRVFHRTRWVEMPMGVVAQCGGKLPPSTQP